MYTLSKEEYIEKLKQIKIKEEECKQIYKNTMLKLKEEKDNLRLQLEIHNEPILKSISRNEKKIINNLSSKPCAITSGNELNKTLIKDLYINKKKSRIQLLKELCPLELNKIPNENIEANTAKLSVNDIKTICKNALK
jgi:hypothetical protein